MKDLDEMSIIRGQPLFMDNCSSCHGVDAKGIEAKEIGLSKAPPNLLKRLKTHSDGDFFGRLRLFLFGLGACHLKNVELP